MWIDDRFATIIILTIVSMAALNTTQEHEIEINHEFRSLHGLKPEVQVAARPLNTHGPDYVKWLADRKARRIQICGELDAIEMADSAHASKGLDGHAPAGPVVYYMKMIEKDEALMEQLTQEYDDFSDEESDDPMEPIYESASTSSPFVKASELKRSR